MSYGYPIDLRSRVLSYLEMGHTQKEACDVFKISRKTIYNWLSLKKRTGGLSLCRSHRYQTSLFQEDKLKDYIRTHSDAYLVDIAVAFQGSISGVCRALKRLGITRKKSHSSIKNATKTKDKNS